MRVGVLDVSLQGQAAACAASQYDRQKRLEKVTTGTGADAPSTQYAHNALGQRVFKTEPLFASSGSGSGSSTSSRNLNNILADPEDQAEEDKDKGLVQTVYEFFTRLWSPGSSDAQKLGFAYVYGQDGRLLGEYGMGGSNSSGTTQYIYLPTANGPMPIAAIVNGVAYAVHSDHLNTPRKLTQADGQVAWQWAYSAFGDEQPTLGSKRFTDATTNPTTGTTTIPEVTFNLRYPGQYYDKESNLHYNYFRSYSAERGRYTQADPIGLDGGFNRFGYVDGNPLSLTDLYGLLSGAMSCKDIVGGSLKSKISYRPNSTLLESYTWLRPLSYGPSSRQNLDPRFPGRSPVKPVIEIVLQIIEHQKWREQIYTLTELFREVLTVCEWREKDSCGVETLHSDSNTRDELVSSDEKLTSDEIRWRERAVRTYTIPIPLP